jgi:preprotein translocase subunit SecY
MLSGFQNASRVPELRRRVIFALAMLAVYRLGVHVPTPGIDRAAMAAFFDQQKNTLFGFLNLFSGGALEQFSVFSLGIMPYISASIILQLLTVCFRTWKGCRRKGKSAGVRLLSILATGRSSCRLSKEQ